jgi:TRAP transporter TAXI family solute receptor
MIQKTLTIWLPILLATIGLSWLVFKVLEPAKNHELSIATGSQNGMYYLKANQYSNLLREEGFKVNILKTAGSVENLQLLKESKADIAFLQGGVANKEAKEELRTISNIYFEPVWIFHRKSHKPIEYLNDLAHKRVSIGAKGSGTIALAKDLLLATKIDINSTNIKHLNTKDAYEAFKRGKLDAFFTVTAASSPLIQEILQDPNIEIARLKRVKALKKHFKFLTQITIPEGSISLVKNIPSKDIKLIATTAALVVKKDLDDTLVRFMTMQVTKAIKEGKDFQKVSNKNLDIPLHEESKNYFLTGDSWLEKIFPYWVASNIDRLKFLLIPILTLLIPAAKSLLPLYRWRIRSRIYRWYKELDILENDMKMASQKKIEGLENLLTEINEQTDVPLAYMGELYALKLHIDTIISRVEKV